MRRLRLNALGPVTASVIGAEPTSPLTQPRLLSLLAYLVLAQPRGHHSRDTLVALLWTEADETSGRQGLRNALHRLRALIGDSVIVSRGESFVAVDPSFIECDVIEFERAVEERRWDDALTAYGGELMQGFHVSDALEFEHWLAGERHRLTSLATHAAVAAAEAREAVGDLSGALSAAQRACLLEPDNERWFRRYLELLLASGDRPAAQRAYDDFARRLQREFGVEPSIETRTTLTAVRSPRAAVVIPAVLTLPSMVNATASPTPARNRTVRRTLIAAAVVVVTAIPVALVSSRPRPPVSLSVGAIAADLPERWRADTNLLKRYLRARALLSARKHAAARDSLFRLKDEAPTYAPALAGFAHATYRSAFEDIPPAIAMPRAVAAARLALALDSTLAVAHDVLVAHAMWGKWDLPGAKLLLDRALVMHPADVELNNLLATWHRWRGEFDASLAIKRRNAALDPLSTRALYQVAPSLYYAHRCEEAVAPYRRLPEEVQRVVGDHILYHSLVCAGYHHDAAEVMREQAIRDGDSSLALAFKPGMTEAQRKSATDRVLQKRLAREFELRRRAWRPSERIMTLYAGRRHADSTLVWLDSMFVDRSMMLYVVPFDPLMDFIRNDPRFDAFLRRLPWLPALSEESRGWIDSLRIRASR